METLITILFGQAENAGAAMLVIVSQYVAIAYLWRALREERDIGKELVNKMLEMSAEAATMVERITGRHS